MKKLLVLSGKGGSGKTTAAAAFISFSKTRAIADCDVDAPNLHLVTKTETEPEHTVFYGAEKAVADPKKCIGCGRCAENCRFGAVEIKNSVCKISAPACEGCGVCEYVCPNHAISMCEDAAGEQLLYLEKRVFSTAQLNTGRGNSGKLVTAVKQALDKHAPETAFAVEDGSPGIGCPVIASVSGVDLVLAVAEPSLSGRSDLLRLVKTTETLGAKMAVCVNKWDCSPENTAAIESFCAKYRIPFVGKIPYDKTVPNTINSGKSIAEIDCPARTAMIKVYQKTMEVFL